MSSDRILRNARLSAIQALVSGAILFLLYRFLVKSLGIEALGIWSLVFALTTVGKVADLGISGGVTRFVARALAQGEEGRAVAHVETAVLTVAVIFLLLGVLLYPLFFLFLGWLTPTHHAEAVRLLPYALLALWIGNVGAVFQAALDGAHQMGRRSLFGMGATMLFFAGALFWVPRAGLLGLAYAQLLQGTVLGIVSRWYLKKELPSLLRLPRRWERSAFREMVGYGSKLQVMGICSMLFDPTTKLLLSRLGDVAAVGYYEMASRMVQQVRGLVVSGSQALVPAVSDLSEREPSRAVAFYTESYRIIFFITVPLMSGLVASTMQISVLWLGADNAVFCISAVLLTVGWAVNSLSGAAFFFGLGSGMLRWNLIGALSMALLNLIGGIAAGVLFGQLGVVVAAAVALCVGGLITIMGYQRDLGASGLALVPRESQDLLATSLLAAAVAALAFIELSSRGARTLALVLPSGLFCALVSGAFWRHPLRPRLRRWVAFPEIAR